ncbi:hypothetical protein HY030_04395 [Candidatus Gottesmanbacteria bacterium]|nr:hypothetical protein [Candidatus Gottesmanbacteria bacterium]
MKRATWQSHLVILTCPESDSGVVASLLPRMTIKSRLPRPAYAGLAMTDEINFI